MIDLLKPVHYQSKHNNCPDHPGTNMAKSLFLVYLCCKMLRVGVTEDEIQLYERHNSYKCGKCVLYEKARKDVIRLKADVDRLSSELKHKTEFRTSFLSHRCCTGQTCCRLLCCPRKQFWWHTSNQSCTVVCGGVAPAGEVPDPVSLEAVVPWLPSASEAQFYSLVLRSLGPWFGTEIQAGTLPIHLP